MEKFNMKIKEKTREEAQELYNRIKDGEEIDSLVGEQE